MDLQAILALMQEMKTSGIENLEWEADGHSLRLTRPVPAQAATGAACTESAPGAKANATVAGAAVANTESNTAAANVTSSSVSAMGAASAAAAEDPAAAAAVEPAGRLICSPVVGVFYAAAAPDQDPFVSQGSVVAAGAPLGIIEAMKLMNEVTSPVDGVVIEILVDNGQRVEYGQPLFRIEEN